MNVLTSFEAFKKMNGRTLAQPAFVSKNDQKIVFINKVNVMKHSRFKQEMSIFWLRDEPPLDEPPCGFQGELCREQQSKFIC